MEDKNKRGLILLAVASAFIYWQVQNSRFNAKATDLVHVLTARVDLPEGTPLTGDSVKAVRVSQELVLTGAIEIRRSSDLKAVADRVTAVRIPKGAQIRLSALVGEAKAAGQSYHDRGAAYALKGDYDLAIDALTRAIDVNPKDGLAYFNRGNARGKKGDYNLAIADFSKAIIVNPKLAQAYFSRGSAYYEKGEADRAIKDCSKALALDPAYAKAYAVRGLAYRAKGENVKAALDAGKYRSLMKR